MLLQKHVLRVLWASTTLAARQLQRILHGHFTDLEYMAGEQASRMHQLAWREDHEGGAQRTQEADAQVAEEEDQGEENVSAWSKRVGDFFRAQGWRRQHYEVWNHEVAGWTWNRAHAPEDRQGGHRLREAWRQRCFAAWLEADRRDARYVREDRESRWTEAMGKTLLGMHCTSKEQTTYERCLQERPSAMHARR